MDPTGNSLAGLLARCREEKDGAWEEFDRRLRSISRQVLRGFPSLRKADREDIASAARERLLVAIKGDRIRGGTDGEIVNYIRRSVRNEALNHLRGRKDTVDVESAAESPIVRLRPPDAVAMAREMLERVSKSVGGWKPEEWFIFVMKLDGVSARRIKEGLEQPPYNLFISVGSVDSRFSKLRARLWASIQNP